VVVGDTCQTKSFVKKLFEMGERISCSKKFLKMSIDIKGIVSTLPDFIEGRR
jgi:hypothetical protein